jgi:hypothetical protein
LVPRLDIAGLIEVLAFDLVFVGQST